MEVHDLAKNEWSLFTEQKWVEFTHRNSGLNTMMNFGNS
jgi:hypothetical protein